MKFLHVFLLSITLLITMHAIVQPQQRVSPNRPPLPETQKFSIPEGINTNIEVLPISFVGADPQSTIEWFKKSLSQLPIKIDQYSTAAERAQFDQLRNPQFDSLGLLPLTLLDSPYRAGQCQKKYNPDAQLFSFELSPQNFPKFSQAYKLSGSKLSVFEKRQSLRSYEASNAYGATVTVTQESIREISLALSDEPSKVLQLLRDAQYSQLPPRYKFRVPMASSEARESDKDIRCLGPVHK